MLWAQPGFEEFTWQKSSVETTRPANTWGTSVTTGAQVKGSYVTVLSNTDVAFDVWGLFININSGSTSGQARDLTVDVATDPAGGTSFTNIIADLLAPCASSANAGGGHNYYFPIGIKAGSTIGVRAAVNNAIPGTPRVRMTVFGKPRYPGLTRRGAGVTSFGIGANQNGTSITSGTGSDGTATALATSISRPHWFWQLGMGINDISMTNGNQYWGELLVGNGTSNVTVIKDQAWFTSSANEPFSSHGQVIGCAYTAPTGSNVYGRLQCSGAVDSSLSMAAYGVYGRFA